MTPQLKQLVDKLLIEPSKVAIYCKTLNEAEDLHKYLESKKCTWSSGEPYKEKETSWNTYRENTVYYISEGMYGSVANAIINGYKVHPFTLIHVPNLHISI
jgi:hypothetical protein